MQLYEQVLNSTLMIEIPALRPAAFPHCGEKNTYATGALDKPDPTPNLL
jgi:hypothetical protein